MQSNTPATPKPITTFGLFYNNASNAFMKPLNAGRNHPEAGDMLVFHMLTFWFTVPVAAVGNTIADLATRAPLRENDLTKLITDIQALDANAVETFVSKIVQYPNPRSNSSMILKDKLLDAIKSPSMIAELVERYCNEFYKAAEKSKLEQKFNDTVAKMVAAGIPTQDIEIKVSLSADEAEAIQQDIIAFRQTKTLAITQQCKAHTIATQRQLILTYLADSKNAGKRMQHVIKAAMDEVEAGQGVELQGGMRLG